MSPVAKAAIRPLVETEGLTRNDLEQVIVAGAFNTFINVKSAITIGMLPDLSLEPSCRSATLPGRARQALISKGQV